eukprot:4997439-Heterocapsa_arctica.AAC.1
MSAADLLAAGLELFKTCRGSIVIPKGGCPSNVIIAVMLYLPMSTTYVAHSLALTECMRAGVMDEISRNKAIN